jgi:hypothetical protein
MSGMPGPMKDEKGEPTRKAAALKRWKCWWQRQQIQNTNQRCAT